MICLKSVSQSFGRNEVLRNVSLSIEKGERFVLIGPSGQGKSTLLKIMGGILPPTQGEVLISDKNLVTLRGKDRSDLMRQMGMLFQKNALFDSLSVGDNIAFPLRETTNLTEKEIQDRIEHFLEAVGLGHAKNLFPEELSGGMQKRLGIARALALNPQIILYDDPTAGLDPITSRKIVQLILSLQKQTQSTLVAVTNDMNRAFQLADRIAMVIGGELLVTGNREETQNHPDPRVAQFIRGQLTGPITAVEDRR